MTNIIEAASTPVACEATSTTTTAASSPDVSQQPAPVEPPAAYSASIYSSDGQLATDFSESIRSIEGTLGGTLWMLIQNEGYGDDSFSMINSVVYKGFQSDIGDMAGDHAILLIESPGGIPGYAYRLCRLFQRRFNRLTVIVPQFAKSAATLVALGGSELILGRDAELGPLDLQVFDKDTEEFETALNAVQSLERLNTFGLVALDHAMRVMMSGTRKRTDVLLPHALSYVTNLLRPLLEKVDALDYAKKSRDLKVAEEYAVRLMRNRYGFRMAKAIARRLVIKYPDHGFVIDRDEAMTYEPQTDDFDADFGLGLKATEPDEALQATLDEIMPFLDQMTVIGRLEKLNEKIT